ncbi:MAG: hypothetical protein Q6K59_08305, partial [Gloeomargarita sp. GMQP_bins_25]
MAHAPQTAATVQLSLPAMVGGGGMGVCSGGGGCRLVGTRRNEGMVTLKLPFNTLVQKGVIALAGLLWVGFLLFHLAGNWLLLDTPGKYNRLAATLTGWGWLFHA